MFESENQKSSNQNWKIEADIRIEATQLTRRIVTALVYVVRLYSYISLHLTCSEIYLRGREWIFKEFQAQTAFICSSKIS